jgi:antitoxin PrlF
MKVTSKGQVTIPLPIREAMGLLPPAEVEFVQQDGRVYLHKKKVPGSRGAKLVGALKGKSSVKMSTDKILALTRGK